MKKRASSQASWSILAGGVSDARVEAYRLHIAINQMVEAINKSPVVDEIYRLCGDNFLTIPNALSNIERYLDKTNYALITMGSDFYRQRLPHSDREMVDLAAKYNPAPKAPMSRSARVNKNAALKIATKLESLKSRLKGLTAEAIQALVDEARGALVQILDGLDFELVSFKMARNLMSNIKVVARPVVPRRYGFGVFEATSLREVLDVCVPRGLDGIEQRLRNKKPFSDDGTKKMYIEAFLDDIDFWLKEHGSILQAIVGDEPAYDTFEEQSNILYQKLSRKGEKVQLFLWATTKLLGKIALRGLMLGLLAMTGLGVAFAYTAIVDFIDEFKKDEWGIIRDYKLMNRLG